jgi:amino acid transporter
MSEKELPIEPQGEKDVGYGESKVSATRRRSSVTPEVLQGELFDHRYETTQRGLKSRYAFRRYHGSLLTNFSIDTPK